MESIRTTMRLYSRFRKLDHSPAIFKTTRRCSDPSPKASRFSSHSGWLPESLHAVVSLSNTVDLIAKAPPSRHTFVWSSHLALPFVMRQSAVQSAKNPFLPSDSQLRQAQFATSTAWLVRSSPFQNNIAVHSASASAIFSPLASAIPAGSKRIVSPRATARPGS